MFKLLCKLIPMVLIFVLFGTGGFGSSITSFLKSSAYLKIATQGNPRQPYSMNNPSGTPNFSAAQILTQKTNGTRILNEIIAAASNLSLHEYVIPPGDYGFAQTFYKNATTSAFMINGIKRPENNPFTIKATGVTFWFDIMNAPAPTWGRAVYFNDCENITLEGLTVDTYIRNAIEGSLSNIDILNNRIEITLLPGTFNDEAKILEYPHLSGITQNRIIPIKANGNLIAPLYNINNTWGPEYLFINDITKSADGKYWLNFKNTTLLNTIFSANWLNAYGNDGTLQLGDGISLLYGVMGGIVIDNSKQLTIKDCNCYIAKGSIFEGGGYGNHKWINVHFSPRPNTNQILGGGENMSEGLRVGSTYDNCYFGLTSDDAINMHGFWGIAQSINGNSVIFDRVPSGVSAGDTIEFYDNTNGQLLYSYIISSINKKSDTDINGNMRDVTITFSQTPNGELVTSNATIWARYTTAECAGWSIKNCVFESNYQRILLQSGPGNFENNLINCMGAGLNLISNFYSYEGGFINHITIKNNTFLNSSLCPNSSPIYVEFINKTTQNQWITDINILNNLIVDCGGEAIRLKNAKNITVEGNIITNPLKYTALSYPAMQRATTAITGSNVSGVTIKDNKLFEVSSYTNGNKFYNSTATLTNNTAATDGDDTIATNAFLAYSNQYTSNQMINFVIPPAETPSDSSDLNNLSIIGSPFTENFTKNALGTLWSYDQSHYSIIQNADSIAGKSVEQDFTNASFGGIYAFGTKNKLVAGATYKLTVSYKLLTDIFPTNFYFGFTRDGFANQKNRKLDFTNNVKNAVYTYTREFTLDNFGDYYLQWFNLTGNDGSKIVIDTLILERLAAPTPPITFNALTASSGNIISGLSQQMTKFAFLQKVTLADGVIVKFFNKNNAELTETAYIGTNTIVKVSLDGAELSTYTTVLKGDIDEDGLVGVSDLVLIKKHLLKMLILNGINKNAADWNSDTKITISDLIALKKSLLSI